MKRREILLVIGLVLFGLIYQAVEKGRRVLTGDLTRWERDSRLLSAIVHEYPQPAQRFAGATELEVDNPAGEVEVEASADGGLGIEAHVRIYHDRQSEADGIARTIRCQAQADGGKVQLKVHADGDFPLNRARVRLRLQVPAAAKLIVKNRFGDLRVRGAGRDVYLKESFGHLFAEDISSNLTVDNLQGNLLVKGIAGHVEVRARYADVDLEEVRSLNIENSHGRMVLKSIRGRVFVRHSHGGVVIENAGEAEVMARHAQLEFQGIAAGLKVSNSFEGIRMVRVGGDIDVSGNYCTISAESCRAEAFVIKNKYSDIVLEDLSARRVDIWQKHGRTRVALAGLRELLSVDSRQADVEVVLPAAMNPTCRLKARFGSIDNGTRLPLEVFTESDERSVNYTGDKAQIVINNQYGNILLRGG